MRVILIILTFTISMLITIGSFSRGFEKGKEQGFEEGKNYIPVTMARIDSMNGNQSVANTQKFIDDYQSMDSTEKFIVNSMVSIIVKAKRMK